MPPTDDQQDANSFAAQPQDAPQATPPAADGGPVPMQPMVISPTEPAEDGASASSAAAPAQDSAPAAPAFDAPSEPAPADAPAPPAADGSPTTSPVEQDPGDVPVFPPTPQQ
jgi:hypothetical protein